MQGAKTEAEGSILEVCDQSRMSQATPQFVHSDAPHNKDTQIQAKITRPFSPELRGLGVAEILGEGKTYRSHQLTPAIRARSITLNKFFTI